MVDLRVKDSEEASAEKEEVSGEALEVQVSVEVSAEVLVFLVAKKSLNVCYLAQYYLTSFYFVSMFQRLKNEL